MVVFPEGTYYKNHMGPGHAGMIRLILSRLSLPFIPVGIHYAPDGMRTRVKIVFGDGLYPGSRRFSQEFVDRIMGRSPGFPGFVEFS